MKSLPGTFSTALAVLVVGLCASAAGEVPLEKIDAKYVCMVNDAAYDREQVRVDVDEKTYYGCCHMCKARLEENETLREGVDPVSGKKVDKATAVIAADSYNRVYYFESEENLEKANKKLQDR